MKKLLLLLLGALASMPILAQRASRPLTTVPQLTDSIQRIMRREHIPGLLLTLVTRDSVLHAGGLGLADVEKQKPVTPHTLFRVGSVTKTFVAVGLLQLVEQGRLSLQDEVQKLAPEIPIHNPWEATNPVRVVHVLEHTAGFDDMGLNHIYNVTATDPRGPASVQVFRHELHCRWRPGERMSYSNPGYQVAGYLLEKLSGQPYEQYLAQQLLQPLGMPDATAALRPGTNPKLACGYSYKEGQYTRVPLLPIYAGPAGSMSASATDLARWVQFFLRDFRTPGGVALLQPGSLRELETAHSSLEARAGLPTGYALANEPLNRRGKAIFRGHSGSIDGFMSVFAYNRELGLGYALSNNGDQSLASIERLVREFLLRRLPPPPAPRPTPLDTAAVAPYLGHYQNAAPRYQMAGMADYLFGDQHLVRHGQLLLLQPLIGSPDTLLPTGPLTFRRPADQLPSAVLTHDQDGRRVLITAEGYSLENNYWWWLRPLLFVASLLLCVTASVAGLVWLILALRRRLPRVQLLPRLLPLLAFGALLATVVAFASLAGHVWEASRLNFETVLLFLGPLAFCVLSLWGFTLTLRRFRLFRSRVVVCYLLLTYGALVWLVSVLGSYGWLGLRLWDV